MAPLHPGCSISTIRSKRRCHPKVTPLVDDMGSAPQDALDEEPDMTEAQLPNNVQHDNALSIVEYINVLLPLISDMALWNKAKQALSDLDGFSSLYYEVFPRNRTRNRHSILPVKAGIC